MRFTISTAADIISEENISKLFEIIVNELQFKYKKLFKPSMFADKEGIIFTRTYNGTEIILRVSFFRPEYACRDLKLITYDINTFKDLNSELILNAVKNHRNDGRMEYESFERSNLTIAFGGQGNEYIISVKKGSHFSHYREGTDYFKNETKDVKQVSKKIK